MLPPTPREVALAWTAIKLYPLAEDATPKYPYSALFTAGILELIIGEIVEISISDCRTLLRQLDALVAEERKRLIKAGSAEAEELGQWGDDFKETFRDVGDGCALLDSLEHQIRDRVSDKHAEEDMADIIEPIERRSPLGLFLRRVSLSMRRLDLAGTTMLAKQVGAWCGHFKDDKPRGVHVADESGMQREAAFKQYRQAMRENDFYSAKDALRRFGDYALYTPHGQHHHVLLNIADTLLQEEAYTLAKETIEEAIRIARSRGDRPCLDHCIKVSKRIDEAAAAKREKERDEDELPEGFPKVVTVSDRLKQSASQLPSAQHPTSAADAETIGQWHLEQAHLWRQLGIASLGQVHMDLAVENANVEFDPYVDVLLAETQELARHGHYDSALAQLVNVDVSRMDMKVYHRWIDAVNGTLQRRDQNHLPNSTSGDTFVPLGRYVVEQLRQGFSAPSVLERAIMAYETARRDQRWDEYASANVAVAYCLVRMDMAPRAVELIEEVWDTVLRLGDADTIAMGEMILAEIRYEQAQKAGDGDYAAAEQQMTKATALAEKARWWMLYKQGEQALSNIAKLQGKDRPVKELPRRPNTVDVWRFAQAVGRKVIGMDA